MGSCVIGLLEPVGDDATRLVDGGQQLAMETAIAKDAVNTRVMSVLPRTPRGHNMGSDMLRMPPGRHPRRAALRTISTVERDGSPSVSP